MSKNRPLPFLTMISARCYNHRDQAKGFMKTRTSEDKKGFLQKVREFLYGMIGFEFEEHAMEMRSSLENLFMAITFGDMLGLPIIPPFYSLKLLPFVVPNISTWKRRVSREREFSDDHEFDLHGI